MLGSPKTIPAVVALPRSISSIAISVGGLALFLVVASYFLILNPIGIDRSRKSELAFVNINSTADLLEETKSLRRDGDGGSGEADGLEQARTLSSDGIRDVYVNGGDIVKDSRPSWAITPFESSNSTEKTAPVSLDESNNRRKIDSAISDDSSTIPLNSTPTATPVSSATSDNGSSTIALNSTAIGAPASSATPDNGGKVDSGASNGSSSFASNSTTMLEPVSSIVTNKPEKGDSRSCNLYHGTWFPDPSGPLYTNHTCPIITQMQNCQGNGRPDKDYENWRWKPDQCDLPRFDPKKFFKLMQGKTLAFIGDSVARNQFESMLCILWQEEAPINRGNRKMQRWFFRSASVNIVRIWSSWLVHKISEPFQFAPEGVDKLHLDVPDKVFMEFIPKFDVVVLSSGHWFAKQSVYIVNNEIVGGQLWWPDKTRTMKIDNVEAYAISVETILTAMVTHPNYTGLTIVRSYSPDHYEGGAWNTGGSCTGKVRPAVAGELAVNQFTDAMHEKQVMGFEKAIKKVTNKSKLRLMDITDAFGYRLDGHPGPYRNPDPNKKTKRGPHGEPPPQDCLHWCMPGPVDTWNELVLEIIRREFEGE